MPGASSFLIALDLSKPKQGKKTPTQVLGHSLRSHLKLSGSKMMKLKSTGIKLLENTGTVSAAAATRKTPTASCSALQTPKSRWGEKSKPPSLVSSKTLSLSI